MINVKDDVIIIASGASLNGFDFQRLRAVDATIIAVNNAVHHVPWADYVFTLDTIHLRDKFDFDYPVQRVSAVPEGYGTEKAQCQCDRVKARNDTILVKRVPFNKNDSPDIMTGCSGFGAYQLAYKSGAKRVFVFGCDHSGQGQYFYGNESVKTPERLWNDALRYWNEFTPPEGVESYNCSPDSNITSLPKISIDEALSMLKIPPMTIVTVLKTSGEFEEKHVQWLQRQLHFPIVCLTNSLYQIDGVRTVKLKYNLPNWWSKMEMFRDDLKLGNFLYVDLDTVFVKGFPQWLLTLNETHVLKDMLGGDHMNSGLMFLMEKDREGIFKDFMADKDGYIKSLRGDQDYLSRYFDKAKKFQIEFPRRIVSYKADILKTKPQGGNITSASIVCFHGKPRPWDCVEHWIPKRWR